MQEGKKKKKKKNGIMSKKMFWNRVKESNP